MLFEGLIPYCNQFIKIFFPTLHGIVPRGTIWNTSMYISLYFQWCFSIPTQVSTPYKCGHPLYLALGWSTLRNSWQLNTLLIPCLIVWYRLWTVFIIAEVGCHFRLSYESQLSPDVYIKNVFSLSSQRYPWCWQLIEVAAHPSTPNNTTTKSVNSYLFSQGWLLLSPFYGDGKWYQQYNEFPKVIRIISGHWVPGQEL